MTKTGFLSPAIFCCKGGVCGRLMCFGGGGLLDLGVGVGFLFGLAFLINQLGANGYGY